MLFYTPSLLNGYQFFFYKYALLKVLIFFINKPHFWKGYVSMNESKEDALKVSPLAKMAKNTKLYQSDLK